MTITMFLTCWTAHTEKNMFVLSKFVIGNKVGVVNIAVWSKDVQKKKMKQMSGLLLYLLSKSL